MTADCTGFATGCELTWVLGPELGSSVRRTSGHHEMSQVYYYWWRGMFNSSATNKEIIGQTRSLDSSTYFVLKETHIIECKLYESRAQIILNKRYA